MSTRDETAPTPPSFRLETFGTLILRGIEGRTVVADHGQKGVRLALLAVLASAGERGCSRDRLLLLFWPDASQKRARHSLEQLLYTMRKSMGEDLFLGVNPIRLNGAVITSDIGDFQHALEVGDPEAVVGHYQGPFLDGFYLSDSPEFEQWMIAERAGLEGVYVKALERRAQSAEAAEEYETAVTWRQKLCDTDPLSGRHAIALMQALADAGDHAAALRHADEYDRLVNQELGTGMGPEIATLAAALRARGDVEPPSRSPDADAFPLKRPSPVASRSPESETGRDPPAARRAEAKPLRRIVPYATAGLAVAALAFAATRLRDAPPVGPAATTSETSIAVLPLANVSGDPADAGLADGMTEELIAVLARSGDLRVIASTSVFALEERSLDVRQIADSLRVSHVVEGGLQKIGSRLRMQVRLVDARDGTTLWSETYDRAFEDVFAVQEEIARAVAQELDVQLAGGDRPGSSLVRHQPKSLAAYEWYLRGMDVGRRQRHEQDAEYFQRAIAADTTYAAAYAGLARTYILMSPGPDRREFEADAERAAR
ncbi:MAG: BTAD domain-containing putative transcriptional regulator, partial [Gemmatimonadota bacterium]